MRRKLGKHKVSYYQNRKVALQSTRATCGHGCRRESDNRKPNPYRRRGGHATRNKNPQKKWRSTQERNCASLLLRGAYRLQKKIDPGSFEEENCSGTLGKNSRWNEEVIANGEGLQRGGNKWEWPWTAFVKHEWTKNHSGRADKKPSRMGQGKEASNSLQGQTTFSEHVTPTRQEMGNPSRGRG